MWIRSARNWSASTAEWPLLRRTPPASAVNRASIDLKSWCRWMPSRTKAPPNCPPRSEEHTSELQSLMRISYAVFCLKKKKTKINEYSKHYLQHRITSDYINQITPSINVNT